MKSALTQKPSTQIPKAFNWQLAAEKTKYYLRINENMFKNVLNWGVGPKCFKFPILFCLNSVRIGLHLLKVESAKIIRAPKVLELLRESYLFIFNSKAGNALGTSSTFIPEVFKPRTDK